MGATGANGSNLAGQVLFTTAAANQSANRFVGPAGMDATEEKATQIMATSGNVTAFYCYQGDGNTTADRTFTLRKGVSVANAAMTFSDTAATCTIASGKRTGGGTVTSVPFSAGDALDIKLPAAVDGKVANFAITIGP